MGILWEIAASLLNPAVVLAGLGAGTILLSQPTKWIWRILGLMILADYVILTSKFQVEAAHGAYDYQRTSEAWERAFTSGNYPPIRDPAGIGPDQYHLAGVQLAGAILVTILFVLAARAVRARWRQQPGESK